MQSYSPLNKCNFPCQRGQYSVNLAGVQPATPLQFIPGDFHRVPVIDSHRELETSLPGISIKKVFKSISELRKGGVLKRPHVVRVKIPLWSMDQIFFEWYYLRLGSESLQEWPNSLIHYWCFYQYDFIIRRE